MRHNLQAKTGVGELDKVINIESPTATRDAATNEEILTWSTAYQNVFARMIYNVARSDSRIENDRELPTQQVVFRIRAEGVVITEKMRINYDGQIFDIKSFGIEARRFYDIKAEARK